MRNNFKNILMLGFVAIGSFLLAWVLLPSKKQQNASNEEYIELINELNDVISSLREEIAISNKVIEKVNEERNEIKKELNNVRKDFKEMENSIINGNADFNFRYLSDFLSEDDNKRE